MKFEPFFDLTGQTYRDHTITKESRLFSGQWLHVFTATVGGKVVVVSHATEEQALEMVKTRIDFHLAEQERMNREAEQWHEYVTTPEEGDW